MKLRFRVIFDLLVIAFFSVFVYQARDWRLQARLYPWAVGIPMLALALIQLVRESTAKDESKAAAAPSSAPVDFQFSHAVDDTVARQRTVHMFAWIFGFFTGI